MKQKREYARPTAGAPQDTPLNPIQTATAEPILGLSAQINAGAARSPRAL